MRDSAWDISKREDELGGKTLLTAGMGRTGSRLATLAKAFALRQWHAHHALAAIR
jgi:phosphoglycerate dehydrogenase-like enzyme